MILLLRYNRVHARFNVLLIKACSTTFASRILALTNTYHGSRQLSARMELGEFLSLLCRRFNMSTELVISKFFSNLPTNCKPMELWKETILKRQYCLLCWRQTHQIHEVRFRDWFCWRIHYNQQLILWSYECVEELEVQNFWIIICYEIGPRHFCSERSLIKAFIHSAFPLLDSSKLLIFLNSQ